MSKRIWITWEIQRRNRTLSRALNARLHEFNYSGGRLMRYLRACIATFLAFIHEDPNVIFVQNPSIVLALLAVHYGRIAGRTVVVDFHNAAIEHLDGRNWLAKVLTKSIIRSADLVIVTNEVLAKRIETEQGKAVILPDPLPALQDRCAPKRLKGEFNVLFVCTWAPDEPFIEVIKAASMVDQGVVIYITGNSMGREAQLGSPLPPNVELTGYVTDCEYISLLRSCDLVMDLTTRQACMVCGGYEAVAAGTPLLLSDTEVLRKYFNRGCLYTDNTAVDIAAKLNLARMSRDALAREILLLREDIEMRDTANLAAVEALLETMLV